MTLAELIRKGASARFATATPATPATPAGERGGKVAKVARVAVATPETATARHWCLHYLDREPLEVIFSDDLACAAVLELYPTAIAAVPWIGPPAAQTDPEPAPADPFPALPTCRQCRMLGQPGQDGVRRCLAATRRYSPVPDIGRRCESFKPLAGDPDQRPGAERWPGLSDAPSTRKETA